MSCRCGWNGQGDHPCHGKGHTCGRPSQHRFYNPSLVSLAGVQMKVQVTDTWACDECWEEFKKLLSPDRSVNVCVTAEWTSCDGSCPDCPRKKM